MIHSTMMDDYSLTIGAILRRGSRVYGTSECVTWTPAGPRRATFAQIAENAAGRGAHRPGDRPRGSGRDIRHHRRPQGRRLLAPVDVSARDRGDVGVDARDHRGGRDLTIVPISTSTRGESRSRCMACHTGVLPRPSERGVQVRVDPRKQNAQSLRRVGRDISESANDQVVGDRAPRTQGRTARRPSMSPRSRNRGGGARPQVTLTCRPAHKRTAPGRQRGAVLLRHERHVALGVLLPLGEPLMDLVVVSSPCQAGVSGWRAAPRPGPGDGRRS